MEIGECVNLFTNSGVREGGWGCHQALQARAPSICGGGEAAAGNVEGKAEAGPTQVCSAGSKPTGQLLVFSLYFTEEILALFSQGGYLGFALHLFLWRGALRRSRIGKIGVVLSFVAVEYGPPLSPTPGKNT